MQSGVWYKNRCSKICTRMGRQLMVHNVRTIKKTHPGKKEYTITLFVKSVPNCIILKFRHLMINNICILKIEERARNTGVSVY